jgi:translation initiation factor 1 (eIF-1/SUI1)
MRRVVRVFAGAKGGGGKKSTPPGANPFGDLASLKSSLPAASNAAKEATERSSSSSSSFSSMTRMSESDAVAALSKGGAMKAERAKSKSSKTTAAPTRGGGAKKPPNAIGAGAGASVGVDIAAQRVRVGVTRSGTKGKTVTVIDAFAPPGGKDAAKEIAQKFKKVLGCGGSVAENGAMTFQGDVAATVMEMLRAMGYASATQTGGSGANAPKKKK